MGVYWIYWMNVWTLRNGETTCGALYHFVNVYLLAGFKDVFIEVQHLDCLQSPKLILYYIDTDYRPPVDIIWKKYHNLEKFMRFFPRFFFSCHLKTVAELSFPFLPSADRNSSFTSQFINIAMFLAVHYVILKDYLVCLYS